MLALRFLTRIPVPLANEPETGEAAGSAGWSSPALGWAMAWFPLVGLIVGAAAAATRWAASPAFGPSLAAALALAAWVAVTGGLHLDGAIDCFDALVVAAPPERRLAILKDVHVGAYGVVGAALLLLIKWLAIAGAPWAALMAAPVLGRMALVYAIRAFPYARPGGMGSAFKALLGTRQVAVAAGTALACVLALAVGTAGPVGTMRALATGAWRGGLVVGAAWLAAGALGAWAARRLGGGITGDVYGLTCEVVEVVALLVWGALYAAG